VRLCYNDLFYIFSQTDHHFLFQNAYLQKNGAPLICLPVADSMKDKVEELSKQQVVLAEKLFHIYQNDIEKVASALGVSRASVERCNATLKPMKFRYIKERKADISAFVVGKHRVWSQKKSGRHFFPCSHKNTCSRKVCPCMKNGYYCTNHCIWGPLSRNFFPGCKCKKHCRSNNCACFAAGRECDPDRCSNCKTCTDPTGKPATKQSCRNDSVRMRRHQHLLVAKSTIPNIGWGCFNKNALKRGQYIHEVSNIVS
jgi:histone-lysine N-methyltransferase EZH2